MNEYAMINAGHAIDGYFLPRPNETQEETFERAKKETIDNLRRSLGDVESLTFGQFKAKGFQKYEA